MLPSIELHELHVFRKCLNHSTEESEHLVDNMTSGCALY